MTHKLGRDLEIHDVIVVMNREHRITGFEPHTGPLDLPAGTRIATSTRPDGRTWGITVCPFDRFDVVEAPVPVARIAARLTIDAAGRPVLDVAAEVPASAVDQLTAELRRVGDLLQRMTDDRDPRQLPAFVGDYGEASVLFHEIVDARVAWK